MKKSFKLFLAAAFVVTEFFIVALPLMITSAKADGHPIQAITHAGFGGGTDVTTRMMLLRARRVLKQDMQLVNKKGGGGAASMDYMMTLPADFARYEKCHQGVSYNHDGVNWKILGKM